MLTLIIALLVHQVTSSNFQCPDVNNLIVQDDYGVQYVVSCGTDADPGAYASQGVYGNWNECFQACSTQQTNGGPCNGFTYAGAYNGNGGGTCYFKGGNMKFAGSGSGLISVSTPERCPGCNIAGYANGTSPRSSSAPGVQTVINPSSQKRQAVYGYTMLQCTDMCDQNEDYVGLTLGSDGRCTQYSYVSGYLPDQAPVAAVPLARAASLPTEISVAATSTNALSSSFTFGVASSQTDTSSIRPSTGGAVSTVSPAQASTRTETSSAGASTYINVSTESPAQASTRTSGINTSTLWNLTTSSAASPMSTSAPAIVTIFVTPSTCTASHSVRFSTTTTYTIVTVGARS
ncbi:hypothetical protein KC351_g5763 [Hortaea werneckii]|nr:hypothetical protein KC351_g5763 [Hortaea werneckii]